MFKDETLVAENIDFLKREENPFDLTKSGYILIET